jgi:hypothetical protein
LFEGDYQFVKEKVLGLADKTFHKLQKDLVDSTLTTGLEKGNLIYREMVETESGDIAS